MIQTNLILYFTILYNLKKKTNSAPVIRKLTGGFAEIFFFFRQHATVLCHCPAFKRHNSLFVPTPKYCTAHPSVLFITFFLVTRP